MQLSSRLEQLLREERLHEEELARSADSDVAPPGAWAARDHLAHFGLWRGIFVDHVQAVLADRTREPPPDDVDAVNDDQLAGDRSRPLEEVVTRWRTTWRRLNAWLSGCSSADLERRPEWYGATSIAGAVVRNSYTHPCGHLVDFHVERGDLTGAADLADEMADTVEALHELDFRFPAGTFSFRAVAFALRSEPDSAVEALRHAIALRPILGPMLHDEATLASLRGRRDFEELTAPHS